MNIINRAAIVVVLFGVPTYANLQPEAVKIMDEAQTCQNRCFREAKESTNQDSQGTSEGARYKKVYDCLNLCTDKMLEHLKIMEKSSLQEYEEYSAKQVEQEKGRARK